MAKVKRHRHSRLTRIAMVFGYTAILLLGAGLAGGLFWLNATVPNLNGEIKTAGLSAPVEVLRDGDGVPLIVAATALDAYMALGFVHAQDRLWQMELQRRAARGTLAAIAGQDAVRADRFVRTLGIATLAERQLPYLSPDVRAALGAYADGVNAWLRQPDRRLPLEFALAGFEPAPWTPADGLLWGRLMAMRLSGNWRAQYLRMRLSDRLSPDRIDELLDDADERRIKNRRVEGPEPSAPWLADASRRALPPPPEWMDGASNAWVLDGTRTASGKPLLANDPHLEFGAPILWYLARIHAPGLSVAGATVPGVPFHILGHNENVAWGFTTAEADVQDLYLEPARPGGYQTPTGTQPFKTRTEIIEVRKREPVRIEVRETRHGPVVGDAIGGPPGTLPSPGTPALALAAAFLADDDRTPEAVYRLNRADNVDEALAVLKMFHSPAQNVLLADRRGAIAHAVTGRIPIRPRQGAGPFDGADPAFDWAGWIPFEEMPRAVSPGTGRLINANDKPDLPGMDRIRGRWAPDYRARRIRERLEALPASKADAAAMAALQSDAVSLAARELLPLLLDAAGPWPERAAELDRLRQWDGAMDRSRAEPLIYMAWLRAMERALYADETGPLFVEARAHRPRFVAWALTDGQWWCDDITTPATEDCRAIARAALDDALADLERRFGRNHAAWRWGAAHMAVFEHPMLRDVPLAGGLAGPRIESDGGPDTVNRGTVQPGDDDTPYAHIHGAGYRAVYDLADLEASRFMIATGQSGNPLSPYYQNMMERWRNGEALLLGGELDARRAGARNRLWLLPAPAP